MSSNTTDLKARAEALFSAATTAPAGGAAALAEAEAEAARAKIARLKALREAKEKAATEQMERASARARLNRAPR
ncbi:hypothetical protein ACLBXM_02560 [Xanthobacteraceae bacterium A53D]